VCQRRSKIGPRGGVKVDHLAHGERCRQEGQRPVSRAHRRLADDALKVARAEHGAARLRGFTETRYAAASWTAERRVITRGQPLLDQLALTCGESAYLVRRRGGQSVTLAEAMPHVSVRGVSWLGRSVPVVRGDAGPVLLLDLSAAELRRLVGAQPLPPAIGGRTLRDLAELEAQIELARSNGVCVLDEQVEAGVASIGAPVRDFQGRLAGAIVVVGPAPRLMSRSAELVAAVVSAAAELSVLLGHTAARPDGRRTAPVVPR
jgi:DNA-binding IclR family transcriptional regulator